MKPKFIELLAFDKNHQLQYEGKCKLRIDRLSKMLLVEPESDEFKMKFAMFKWDFFMDRNILFVFAEHELSDFALVFDEEKRCKKVHNFIHRNKTSSNIENEIFCQRFMIPVCENIVKNGAASKLKKIFAKWIDKHERNTREEYVKLLKENNVYDIVYGKTDEGIFVGNNVDNKREHRSRKRRHSEMNGRDMMNFNEESVHSSRSFTIYVNHTDFKYVNVKKNRGTMRKLLIFTSSERNNCYEYTLSNQRRLFYCNGCRNQRKDITAISDKDENGFECIKLEDKEHACIPIPYTPEKYIELKIFRKPEYEILENNTSVSGRLIIIFDKDDKNQCWEFRSEKRCPKKSQFVCRKCNSRAKLWNAYTENEYLELRNANHKCKFIPYQPKKYYQYKDFVISPNFEVQTYTMYGQEKKKLIIFDENDRSLRYVYFMDKKNVYWCTGCQKKKSRVSAKLLENSDGVDYVILSKAKHVCELRPHSIASKEGEAIIRQPNFELMENTSNGVKKLFIFDLNDRSLCYTFSWTENTKNRYFCLGCYALRRSRHSGNLVRAQLCKDENGETFIRFNDGKHICKPKKYEPEIYGRKEIQKCYDYFFFGLKRSPNSLNVAIYHPKNHSLCYKLSYRKKKSYFQCHKCLSKGLSFFVRIEKDENRKEYFNHDYKQHVCQPIKVSSTSGSKFKKLKRNELNLEKEKPQINESNIIRPPDFELSTNAKGVKDGTLFIFNSEDRTFGHKYFYSNFYKCYKCSKTDNCRATAKLEIDENGEKRIILGPNEHKCERVTYEKVVKCDERIIDASEFITLSQNSDDDKITKIILFTTIARDECYEYGRMAERHNDFRCYDCSSHNKYVGVKLCKNINGQQCLQISKQSHVCTPKKYIKEKYEPKIIPSELFEFHPNSIGEENKRIIIFTSEKKDLVYEYFWKCGKTFTCGLCRYMKKIFVCVYVREDKNGQKYIESGDQKHICEPQKYNPYKYDPKAKIISSNNFILYDGSCGEKDKNLILFTSKKKDSVYQYTFDKSKMLYLCNRCKNKKLHVSAKVIINEDGSKSIKMGENEHICEHQIYDPTKYNKTKIISNNSFSFQEGENGVKDKYLIVFTSKEKDRFYQLSLVRPAFYKCYKCRYKQKTVSARVIVNEDGSKSIKMGENEHICEHQIYDPTKYNKTKIISNNSFSFHEGENGVKDKYLIVFTSKEKDRFYQLSLVRPAFYKCYKCRYKQKTVSARVIVNEDGSKSIKMGENEHVCEPQKYDPEKFITK